MAGMPVAAVPLQPGATPIAWTEKTQKRIMAGWLSAAAYLIGLVVLLGLAGNGLAIMMALARYLNGRPMPPRSELLDPSGLGLPLWSFLLYAWGWGELALIAGFTALALSLMEKKRLSAIGLRWSPNVWRDLLVGLALAAVLFISVVGIGAGKGWYSVYSRMTAIEGLVVTLGGLGIVLPLAAVEEIAVRGYLLQALERSWGRWLAVAVSSVIFAFLHAQNRFIWSEPLAFVGLCLAGLYLASAYLITGNLWLAIFLHAGWNLMEGPIFGLPVSGTVVPISVLQTSAHGPALWTGGQFGPEAGLLLCLLMVVHIAALWAMRPVLKPAAPAAEPDPNESHARIYRAIPLETGP
jgi:uncharacterized protein